MLLLVAPVLAEGGNQGTSLSEEFFQEGLSELATGDPEESLPEFDLAIALDPSNDCAYFNRAMAYMELGEFRKAKRDLDATIELVPGDAKAYFNRALVERQLGNLEAARQDARKAEDLFRDLGIRAGVGRASALRQRLRLDQEAGNGLSSKLLGQNPRD
jgi:Tfp pilus assembly protein PilF